jgi:hypothetical protein
LNVVEKRHKSRECVRDRVGATVAIENINHFKTLVVETQTSVLEKKAKPPILDSNAELTLPITTGLRIGRISDEKVIRMAGAKSLRAKVVGNFVLEVQKTFHVFDLGKLERLRRAERGRGERSQKSGGRRRTRRRRRRRRSRDDNRRSRARRWRPTRKSEIRGQRGGDIPTGQRTQRRNCRSSERRHRCKDVGMSPRRGRHPMRKDDRRNRCRNMIRKGVGPISLVGGEERGT